MYINWELFGHHLLWILIALIPQTLIFLKILFFKIIADIASRDTYNRDTEREIKTILWARHIYYDSDENDHIPLYDRLDTDDYRCFKWYKVFCWITVVLDILAAIAMLVAICGYPSENSEVKTFINKDYAFYTALEHPTAKQCRDAEAANNTFVTSADGTFCIKVEHDLIDTNLLWAKFYNDVENKAELLKEAGSK